MHKNLHLGGSVVVNLACLYLSLFNSLENGVDKCGCGFAVWYLPYDECLVVEFFNLCPYLQHPTALSVVIAADVDAAAGGEVWIKLERLSMEIGYGSVTQLPEVMWENLRRESYGNALGTLCK